MNLAFKKRKKNNYWDLMNLITVELNSIGWSTLTTCPAFSTTCKIALNMKQLPA